MQSTILKAGLCAIALALALLMCYYILDPSTVTPQYFKLKEEQTEHQNDGLQMVNEKDLFNQVTSADMGSIQKVREKGRVHNLTKVDVDKLSTEELVMTMHSYLDNTDVLCHRKFRMGVVGDGGWEVCDDPGVRPRPPCIIYSFGINNDFSFDDDAAKMYGCHVYSFDPSMTNEKDQFDRSSNVHFYKIGISGRSFVNGEKWPLFTFRDIRIKLGHLNSTVDVVKMDIESSEWDALPDMAVSGELTSVRQFLVEYHVTSVSRDYLLPRLKVIQTVERLGFKKFYVHKNHACKADLKLPVGKTACYEIHYLKN